MNRGPLVFGLSDADQLAIVRTAEVMRIPVRKYQRRPRGALVSAQPKEGAGDFPGVDIDAVHRNWGVTSGIRKGKR